MKKAFDLKSGNMIGIFSILILLSFGLFIPGLSQSKKTIRELRKMRKGNQFSRFYHKSQEEVERRERKRLEMYGLQKHDTIASLGAGWGYQEVAFGTMIDSMVFYLEDINPEYLNQERMQFNFDYYTILTGKPVNSQFFFQIGNETETGLPGNSFDRVLVINAFHEFSHQEEMIMEMKRILKTDGWLLLNEFDAFHSGNMHMGCNHRIYTEEEIIEMFSKYGFRFKRSTWDMKPMKKVPGNKVYVFRK
jgi:ubiquinone/menaquinone biosynthesis C-methylase UbiE